MTITTSPAAKVDLFKQLRRTEYQQPKTPALVEIGAGRYLSVEGEGAPGGADFEVRIGALYGVAYTLKMTRKAAGRQDYVVGKLEGRWWSDRGPDLANVPREEWRWQLLIRTPDFVAENELAAAVEVLLGKGKDPAVRLVRLENLVEGACVQMLHLGPFDREWETISQMLEHARALGYEPHGRHHEIYLSDPRRVPPERLKTILRLPVRRREH